MMRYVCMYESLRIWKVKYWRKNIYGIMIANSFYTDSDGSLKIYGHKFCTYFLKKKLSAASTSKFISGILILQHLHNLFKMLITVSSWPVLPHSSQFLFCTRFAPPKLFLTSFFSSLLIILLQLKYYLMEV